MEQSKNITTPESATDEPDSSFNPQTGPEAFAFASEAEEDAYWAGVTDGMRNVGGAPVPRLAARARDVYPELVATAEQLGGRAHPASLDFDPVSTRHRIDGLTPDKQREYVEALADSGVARYAAARIGVSEQAINRLRRRADARSFNLACDAAMRLGARRLHSIAYERAIEGTIKRHYYHGELKSEERVYDNRLLIYLLGKTEQLLDEPEAARAVADNWQPWVEAMEQGLPAPDLTPEPGLEPEVADENVDEDGFNGGEVWEEEGGRWWTSFPPPAGFDGEQWDEPGTPGYRRILTDAEREVVDEDAEDAEGEERQRSIARECARRDLYFGFEGDRREGAIFPPREAELYETSDPESSPAFAGEGDQP